MSVFIFRGNRHIRLKLFARIALLIVLLQGLFTETRVIASFEEANTNQTQTLPFPIQAPWPAGIIWHVGNDGSFYYDCNPAQGQLHCNWDYFALDFNGSGSSNETNDEGVLVLSVADGVVIEAKNRNDGYGSNVVIGHEFGYESRYAHLRNNALLVKAGQWVSQGTPLGYVDGSGGFRPHLHFAMYHCDTGLSTAQCNLLSNLNAVRPEPFNGIPTLTDGQQIRSSNYGVGYEEMRVSDIYDVNNLRKHTAFNTTYDQFGGNFIFGMSQMPVRNWPGTNYLYQEFGPSFQIGFPWYGMNTAMVENNGIAYFIIGPVWEIYYQRGGLSGALGLPISHTYEWKSTTSSPTYTSYRNDFERGSIVWNFNGTYEIVDENNASWQTSFFATPNLFTNPTLLRQDKYIDFEWVPKGEPGNIKQYIQLGPSVIWNTTKGGILPFYKIKVTMQGHIEIRVEGEVKIQADSPDQNWTGSSTEIGFGSEDVEVKYWQEPGKQAKIFVTIDNVIKIPEAFASEGAIDTSTIPNSTNEYAEYTPPPYPLGTLPTPSIIPPIGGDSSTVLIFDASDTMNMDDPSGMIKIDAAKQAGERVFDILEAEKQAGSINIALGIASFNYQSYENLDPTSDLNAARATLNSLSATGRTAMADGLQLGLRMLGNIATGSKPLIILLSDGLPNVGLGGDMGVDEGTAKQQVLDLASQAASSKICIYVVGFGDPAAGSIDEDFLRSVAQTSGCGAYYNAQNATALANVYVQLRHVSTGNILLSQTGNISQGQQLLINTVNVPVNQSQMLYTLNWPGSQLGAILIDPQGQQVASNYQGASLSASDYLASVIIQNPLEGQWQVQALGVNVPEGTTTYNAILSVRPNTNKPTVTTPTMPGFPVALLTIVLGGGVVMIIVLYTTVHRKRIHIAPRSGTSSAMRVRLIVLSGQNIKQSFDLNDGMAIGRNRSAGICLTDTNVSRQHAVIRFNAGSWFIQDQGSKGGTFVNGQKISAMALKTGDRIRIGSTEFEFRD